MNVISLRTLLARSGASPHQSSRLAKVGNDSPCSLFGQRQRGVVAIERQTNSFYDQFMIIALRQT